MCAAINMFLYPTVRFNVASATSPTMPRICAGAMYEYHIVFIGCMLSFAFSFRHASASEVEGFKSIVIAIGLFIQSGSECLLRATGCIALRTVGKCRS